MYRFIILLKRFLEYTSEKSSCPGHLTPKRLSSCHAFLTNPFLTKTITCLYLTKQCDTMASHCFVKVAVDKRSLSVPVYN